MSIDVLINMVIMHPRPWILTGAGISTESGIPDFRSSGGLWDKVDPIENFSTWALYNNPEGFFRYGIPMFEQILAAKPNPAHLIVGELQAKRFIGPIITQNVDSLHQKGGASWVYEVHGHIRTATCVSCHKKVVTMEELFKLVQKGKIPPKCDCGGILKPDVILFGDAMPDDFQDAINLIRCYESTDNMIIVIGSSLTVSPINSFPLEFEKLAIINNSETALDEDAQLIINGSASEIMRQFKARLLELNNNEELQPLPGGFILGRLVSIITDLWSSYKAKKDIIKQEDRLDKIMTDILLLENLFTKYPKINHRPALEIYMLNLSLRTIQKIKDEIMDLKKNFSPINGYIPRSVNDIIDSHYEALVSYINQSDCQTEVVKELVLQILGLIGLYKYMGTLDNQDFDYELTDELLNKLIDLIKHYKFDIDIEKALNDY